MQYLHVKPHNDAYAGLDEFTAASLSIQAWRASYHQTNQQQRIPVNARVSGSYHEHAAEDDRTGFRMYRM